MEQIKFRYHNHRGVWADRTVTPVAIEFLNKPGYGYKPGWFLSGFDHDKQAQRSFALANIAVTFKDKSEIFTIPLKAGAHQRPIFKG